MPPWFFSRFSAESQQNMIAFSPKADALSPDRQDTEYHFT